MCLRKTADRSVSWIDHAFEEFEDKSEFNDEQVNMESRRPVELFKDDHAFEEFEDESEFNDDQVDGRSNSSKTTTPSKSSKTKASSMTTKSMGGQTVQRRLCLRRVQRRKRVQCLPCLWRVRRWKRVQWRPCLRRVRVSGRSGRDIGPDLHLLQVRGRRPIWSGNSDKTNSQKRLLTFPSLYKPQGWKCEKKVAAYSPEFTVHIWSLIYI